MLSKLLVAWSLMAVSVLVHAAAVVSAIRWARQHLMTPRYGLWSALLVALAGWLVFAHLIEITVWALFYVWESAMPDLPSALYFSAVTYTTTGYGDLVLTPEWRLAGGVEALTGILMCGWSTALFVTALSRMLQATATSKDSMP